MSEDNGYSELVLSLNLEDSAARSIMFAYLQARGVEPTSPQTSHVLRLAQVLNAAPDSGTDTFTQNWFQFLQFTTPLTDEDMPAHSCTIEDLELCFKGFGYEVAAVILRALPDEERESWRKDFEKRHTEIGLKNGKAITTAEAAALRIVNSHRNDPDVEVTRSGATVTFTKREGE